MLQVPALLLLQVPQALALLSALLLRLPLTVLQVLAPQSALQLRLAPLLALQLLALLLALQVLALLMLKWTPVAAQLSAETMLVGK